MKNERNKKNVRDEEWAKEKFGDVGERPSDEIKVDPEADPSPNIGHPE